MELKKRLYLLEDDESIAELVSCALEMNGIETDCFTTCANFLSAVMRNKPDVALLDVMLPDGSGLDVLKTLKESSPNLPVMILSALGRESDKVKGLNLGADDYLSKPFGVLELSARVNVLLRRVQNNAAGNGTVKKCGQLVLDEAAMTATLKNRELTLNPKEFALLNYFMDNIGKALSREKLLLAVWGYDYGGGTRTVDNHVARLRKTGLEHYFATVFGTGYKFAPPEEKSQNAK